MDFTVAPGNFINDIIKIVDSLTANFIKTGFEAIVDNWVASGLLTSILTLYILYFLYQVHFYNTPLSEATPHLVKVCVVFSIATNWGIFYILIYNVLTNEPMHMTKMLLAGMGMSMNDGSLNDTFIQGMDMTFSLLRNMPFSFKGVICTVIAAALLVAGTFLFTIIALSLIIISKFYLAVFLAIAPYFLIMYLFNGSKGLAESWVKSCLNYALIPLFVGCVLLLTTTLAKACLNAGASFGAEPKSPEFTGVILYFFAGLISAFLLKTIPEKTASLTSSLAIAGAGRMANYSKNLTQNAQSIGSKAKQGVNSARNNFSQRQAKLSQQISSRAQARKQTQQARYEKNSRGGIY